MDGKAKRAGNHMALRTAEEEEAEEEEEEEEDEEEEEAAIDDDDESPARARAGQRSSRMSGPGRRQEQRWLSLPRMPPVRTLVTAESLMPILGVTLMTLGLLMLLGMLWKSFRPTVDALEDELPPVPVPPPPPLRPPAIILLG